jgi:hypothetical protein
MLRQPPAGDAYLTYLVGYLNAELGRREPTIVGVGSDGVTLRVRFRAPLGVEKVQVHVQSSDAGEGGMTYDPNFYVSSDLVDCRADRLQDRIIPVTAGTGYVVFLVPWAKDGAGNTVLFDGQNGRPDNMAILMPWLADAEVWDSGSLLTDTAAFLTTDTGRRLALSGA